MAHWFKLLAAFALLTLLSGSFRVGAIQADQSQGADNGSFTGTSMTTGSARSIDPLLSRSSDSIRLAQADKDKEEKIEAGNPVAVPLKWNGVWVSAHGKGWLNCTAQFVSQHVILLAAHCVRDQAGPWFAEEKNSFFLLQYQNQTYAKKYQARCIYLPQSWSIPIKPGEDLEKPESMSPERRNEISKARVGKMQYDFAFVYLDAESITGHYSLHINEGWNSGTTVGYPGDMMRGQIIQIERGKVAMPNDLSDVGNIPNEQVFLQSQPKYGPGASGGAWVANFGPPEAPDRNVVFGLNSFLIPSMPGAIFGPKFGNATKAILDYTETHCP